MNPDQMTSSVAADLDLLCFPPKKMKEKKNIYMYKKDRLTDEGGGQISYIYPVCLMKQCKP